LISDHGNRLLANGLLSADAPRPATFPAFAALKLDTSNPSAKTAMETESRSIAELKSGTAHAKLAVGLLSPTLALLQIQ